MSGVVIPIVQDSNAAYPVILDGQSYVITVRYNQRLVNVSTSNPVSADEFELGLAIAGEPEIIRTPMKTNRDLLLPYKSRTGCPQGKLILRDMAADINKSQGKYYAPERVSYEELGSRFVLIYYNAA